MKNAAISRAALRRIIASLVTAEINRLRDTQGVASVEDNAAWSDDCVLSVRSVDLDSLETVHVAAALHEMFVADMEAYDLFHRTRTTVGHWLDDITAMQRREDARLVVMTSGSTGRPKPCVHGISDLQTEAVYFSGLLPSAKRLITLVPAHHIYGLIWTALLPAQLDIPVIAASSASLPRPSEGDIIVAVPDQWRAMLRSRLRWPANVCGVSAGAPLEDGLAIELLAAGLSCIFDVYGTSETAGVGVRKAPDPSYVLLPRWRFTSGDSTGLDIVDQQGQKIQIPDHVAINADGSFQVLGRRDGAVQVGGVNVWPQQVAKLLKSCPGVADADVRLGEHRRLKAFVVPTTGSDETELLDRLRRYALQLPQAEQRPTAYRFGIAIPKNVLGKACDWS